jgi:hypothetical protein
MKIALAGLGILAAVLVFGFGMTYYEYGVWSFFAPKVVAVQNRVFHESQQYNDGMIRDLENLRMEYLKATPEQKDALRATILHRFAGYDEDRLTPQLRSFYDSLNR